MLYYLKSRIKQDNNFKEEKEMERKHIMAVLAVTMLAIPVSLTGCSSDVEELPVETSEIVLEVISDTEVSETIEEDLSDTGIEIEESDALDDSAIYITTMYCTGNINVYVEPSETAEILGTLPDQTAVSTLGIHHISQFFKVELDDGTIGYIRTVDLTEFGEYNEETDLVDEIPADETDSEDVDTTTGGGGSNSTDNMNMGGMSDDDFMNLLEQNGFGGGEYYAPGESADGEEIQFGQGDYSGGVGVVVQ